MVKPQILIGAAALVVAAGLGYGLYHYLQPDPPPPERSTTKGPRGADPPRFHMLQCDFGTLAPGEQKSQRLKITNDWPKPWRLREIRTHNCKCAEAKLSPKTLAPGQSAWLEVTFRARPEAGSTAATIMVDFDCPRPPEPKDRVAQAMACQALASPAIGGPAWPHVVSALSVAAPDALALPGPAGPVFQVMVRGDVRALLVANPPSLDFKYTPAGTRLKESVTLRNTSPRRCRITGVKAPEWIQCDWEPPDGTGPSWKLTVLANPDKLHTASGSDVLLVHTDPEQIGPASIRVSLTPPLKADPNELDFGTMEPGQEGRKKVMLHVVPELGELTEKDLVLTHGLGPELDVQVHKEGPRLFELLVQLRPKGSRGPIKADLQIKTHKAGVLPARVKIMAKVYQLKGQPGPAHDPSRKDRKR
jgi:hypothetical protein